MIINFLNSWEFGKEFEFIKKENSTNINKTLKATNNINFLEDLKLFISDNFNNKISNISYIEATFILKQWKHDKLDIQKILKINLLSLLSYDQSEFNKDQIFEYLSKINTFYNKTKILFSEINFIVNNNRFNDKYYNNYYEALENILIKYFTKKNDIKKFKTFIKNFNKNLVNYIFENLENNQHNINEDNIPNDIDNSDIFYLVNLLGLEKFFFKKFNDCALEYIKSKNISESKYFPYFFKLWDLIKIFYKNKLINNSLKTNFDQLIFDKFISLNVYRLLEVNFDFDLFNKNIYYFNKLKKLYVKFSDISIIYKIVSNYIKDIILKKFENKNIDNLKIIFQSLNFYINLIFNENNFSFKYLKNLLINEFSKDDYSLNLYLYYIDSIIKNDSLDTLKNTVNFNFLFTCNNKYIESYKNYMIERIINTDKSNLSKEKYIIDQLKIQMGYEADDLSEIFDSLYINEENNLISKFLLLKNKNLDKNLWFFNLPEELLDSYNLMLDKSKGLLNKKNIKFCIFSKGTTIDFKVNNFILKTNLIQAIILLSFTKKMSFENISKYYSINDIILQFYCNSLHKLKILDKNNDVFSINTKYFKDFSQNLEIYDINYNNFFNENNNNKEIASEENIISWEEDMELFKIIETVIIKYLKKEKTSKYYDIHLLIDTKYGYDFSKEYVDKILNGLRKNDYIEFDEFDQINYIP